MRWKLPEVVVPADRLLQLRPVSRDSIQTICTLNKLIHFLGWLLSKSYSYTILYALWEKCRTNNLGMRESEAATLPLSTAPDPINQTATTEQALTVMHHVYELILSAT